MNYDKVINHFKIHKQQANKIQAFCPSHDDKNASLSILLSEDKILLFCHAGCKIDDILKAVNLTYADLFEPKPTAIYQYRKADGSLSHEKLKYTTSQGKRFAQRRVDGDKIVDNLGDIERIPYNLPSVIKAISKDEIVLYVEGEKDADTGRMLGYTATTMGGASDWKPEYVKYFKNANLTLIPDKDKAGTSLTQKMIEDLKKVARSLKIIVLPSGKDLTEWVELGNSDLNDLISKADDLIPFAGLPRPDITKTLNGYVFEWDKLNITIKIERLTDDLEGVISVIDKAKNITVHKAHINLLATRSLTELGNKLSKFFKCDWGVILSQVAIECSNIIQFIGDCDNINAEPVTMSIEYLLEPILPKNEPTTIFTSGGKGKSIFADYLAVLVQFGICGDNGLAFTPSRHNVLYLDWEADKETHRRYITAIKKGMGIDNTDTIRYLRLDHPLAQVADGIRELIAQYDIGLIIIDSQMAATASGTRGLTEAQVASEYYNILRSFGITTLTIDHITKQAMSSDNNDAPYGTVVKYNRSRSQFELKLADDYDDADHKEYALVHKKFNLGRKQKPIGIKADFINSTNGNTLVELRFGSCDVKDNPQLNKILPKVDRIINYLQRQGKASIKDIAEAIGENPEQISSLLANKKNRFIKIERGVYGLLEKDPLLQ